MIEKRSTHSMKGMVSSYLLYFALAVIVLIGLVTIYIVIGKGLFSINLFGG